MGIKSGLERKLASYRESPRELILDVADYFTGYRGIAELVSNYRKYPKLSDTDLCKLNSTWSTIITAVEVVAIATHPQEFGYILAAGEVLRPLGRAYFGFADSAIDKAGSLAKRVLNRSQRYDSKSRENKTIKSG